MSDAPGRFAVAPRCDPLGSHHASALPQANRLALYSRWRQLPAGCLGFEPLVAARFASSGRGIALGFPSANWLPGSNWDEAGTIGGPSNRS